MHHYIAELDDQQKITAVWIKEDTSRAARVFDPRKHIFDPATASGFSGAPKEKIERWITRAHASCNASA